VVSFGAVYWSSDGAGLFITYWFLLFIPPPISCLIELKNFSIPGSNVWYKSCHFGGLGQDCMNLEGGYWEMESKTELRTFLLILYKKTLSRILIKVVHMK
jgi:hypothetical protein